jgi:hypothetical protein
MAHIVISKKIVFNKKYDFFQLTPGNFTVTLDLDKKLQSKLEKDSLLLQELSEIAGEYYDEYVVKVMNTTLNQATAVFELASQKGAPESFFKTQIAGLNKTLAQNVEVASAACQQAVLKRCADFAKTKKEYSKYKWKIGAKIVATVASLVTSISLLATSSFTMGVGTVASIYGISKTTASLAQQIAAACQEAETTLAAVKRNIEKLRPTLKESLEKRRKTEILLAHPAVAKSLREKGPEETAKTMYSDQTFKAAFASEKKLAAVLKTGELSKGGLSKSSAGKEVLATLGSWALSISVTSIKSLDDSWDTLKNKTKGIEVKSHDFSKQLSKILNEQEKLDADFKKALQKNKIPGTKQEAVLRKNYDNIITKSTQKVMQMLDKTQNAYTRFKKMNKEIQDMDANVETILSLRGKWFERLDNALEAANFLMALSGGEFSGCAAFFESIATDLTQTTVEFAVDKFIDKVTAGT